LTSCKQLQELDQDIELELNHFEDMQNILMHNVHHIFTLTDVESFKLVNYESESELLFAILRIIQYHKYSEQSLVNFIYMR
jgi:hypothetical protein